MISWHLDIDSFIIKFPLNPIKPHEIGMSYEHRYFIEGRCLLREQWLQPLDGWINIKKSLPQNCNGELIEWVSAI